MDKNYLDNKILANSSRIWSFNSGLKLAKLAIEVLWIWKSNFFKTKKSVNASVSNYYGDRTEIREITPTNIKSDFVCVGIKHK